MAATVLCAMLSLVMMVVSVRATTHIVGGSSGWSPTTDLLGWASGNTFVVGDTLVFNFGSNHAVQEVTENDYNNCNTVSPLSSHSGGKTIISINKVGPSYFICPTPGHCQGGMKLSITVLSGPEAKPDTDTRTPSIPTIPVRDPRGSIFPPPISGYYGPPSIAGGLPCNPTLGPCGWTYDGWGQGAAPGKLKGGMVLWSTLVVAALVGVMHG